MHPSLRRRPLVGLALLLLAGCAHHDEIAQPAPVAEIRPGYIEGYLPHSELPNSLALLPPPPAAGSAAMALDEAVARQRVLQRGSARWRLAMQDADLSFPAAAGTFSCALGAPISQALTPHLYQLLRRSLTDAGLATYSAKDHYQRARPFTWNHQPICTPQEQAELAQDGSYPSGHTAIGWAWALILSELAPARGEAVIARGLAFGESRNVCNVHWHSDVLQGRTVAAATACRRPARNWPGSARNPCPRSATAARKPPPWRNDGRGSAPGLHPGLTTTANVAHWSTPPPASECP